MADTKNTGLAELAAVPADDDLLYLVDVSDTSMAGTGTSKKNKAKYVLRTNGTANTLGANIAANGYNFTGAGTVGAGAILAANYYGGTASGGTATISSTTHATKGKLLFGTASAFDETNNALGLNTLSPDGLQVGCAVAESARGVDNVRMGVVSGAPRIILEDAGATQWNVDNFNGAFRIFNPGTVRLTLDTSGNLDIAGIFTLSGSRIGEGWTAVTFNTGWGNLGGGWQGAAYKKIGDMVFLRGVVARSSGVETTMFTLPSGYRPAGNHLYPIVSNNDIGRVDLSTTGALTVSVGSPDAWVGLDGIFFSTV